MVSVVIPSAHNAIDIEKCIDAVLGQTCAPSEIIIVDSYGLGNYDKKQLQAMCQNKCAFHIISHCEKLNPGGLLEI
jgi:hypothetical protein